MMTTDFCVCLNGKLACLSYTASNNVAASNMISKQLMVSEEGPLLTLDATGDEESGPASQFWSICS